MNKDAYTHQIKNQWVDWRNDNPIGFAEGMKIMRFVGDRQVFATVNENDGYTVTFTNDETNEETVKPLDQMWMWVER